MIWRPNALTLAALASLAAALTTAPLGAQSVDSTRRWSLFGGTVATQGFGGSGTGANRLASNFEIGGSGDFRVRAFPLPLRATAAASHIDDRAVGSDLRFATFSLDAVGRPVPKIFGAQLYLLGGLGVGMQAAHLEGASPSATTPLVARRRHSWGFGEVGTGIDLGHLFFEVRFQAAITSNEPRRTPIRVGLRF
jgi:hypothetical protein